MSEELGLKWHKSSHSGQNGGECIEIASGLPGVVPVRDSKDASGDWIVVSESAWQALVSSVK